MHDDDEKHDRNPPLTVKDAEHYVELLRRRLDRPNANKKGLATIKAFVESLRVETATGGFIVLRSARKGSWNKNSDTERKTRSELAAYHLPLYLPYGIATESREAIYRIDKLERGGDHYVFRFDPPPESFTLVRDDDYSDLRRRMLKLELEENHLVTVVQHTNIASRTLIGSLMDKKAIVSLFMQNPMHAKPEHLRPLLWNRALDIVPDYVCHTGSLDVWLYDTPASFHAVWVEKRLIAVGWYTYIDLMHRHVLKSMIDPEAIMSSDELAQYELPMGVVGFTNPLVIAEAGSREYKLLSKMVHDFTVMVEHVGGGPTFVIVNGTVKRAMGDH